MAVYDTCYHLHMTMRLRGKPGTIFAEESWQVGWRFALAVGDPLGKDSGRQVLPVSSVQDAFVSRDNTEFDIEQGFSGVTVGGVTITDADQDLAADTARVFLSSIKTSTSANYALESVRLYPCGPDGKSLTAPSIYRPKGTTQDPTGATSLPTDVAIAISTQTATRGVKGRGRVFIGVPDTTTLDTNGAVKPTIRTQLATAQASMFDTLRAMGTGTSDVVLTPVIWHRPGDKTGIEDGTFGSPIRAVRVDDRCDTQRRRDRQIVSTWTSVPLS